MDPLETAPKDAAATAVGAAMRAAAFHRIEPVTPTVIQETNNVVVRLSPDIIAKVGRWPHSADALRREHAVAMHLAAAGALVGPPVADVGPFVDDATGFVVTIWHALDIDPEKGVAPAEAARELRAIHEHLARYDGTLPDVREHVELARAALDNDDAMAALPPPGRDILRGAIDSLTDRVAEPAAVMQVLHGEPHLGNVLATRDGPRWIDFEGACVGPLEWDVAFLPAEAEHVFDDRIDARRMALARTLISACVATWCWVRADIDGMLGHARHHLERVSAAMDP